MWADNWFTLYINGELVGEDSAPITTEPSFNSEMIEFEATYPLTIAGNVWPCPSGEDDNGWTF